MEGGRGGNEPRRWDGRKEEEKQKEVEGREDGGPNAALL